MSEPNEVRTAGAFPPTHELAFAAGALYGAMLSTDDELRKRGLSGRDREGYARVHGLIATLAGTRVEGVPPARLPSIDDLALAADYLASGNISEMTKRVREWLDGGACL